MMPEVFISYKRERRAAAEHMAEILKLYGYDVWFDYSLVKGKDFGLQIDTIIRSSKALVVLWCKRSVASRWVHEEVDLGHDLGILIPTKIEPCELPVGNRRVDYFDLSSWDGAPRSAALDDLLLEIGRRVGKDPSSNFLGLREYESLWRRFGAPPLAAFALEQGAAEPRMIAAQEPETFTSAGGGKEPRDLGVLNDIWKDLRSSEDIDRLARFLEQVRGTPLDVAVEERMATIERAATSTETAEWLREARPILEQVKALYESMGWKQAGPEPDGSRFADSLRLLIRALPQIPVGADAVHVSNSLDEYLNTKLHHGVPIPDDYTLEAIYPLPGSHWGQSFQRVRACRRPGVKSSAYVREGFGGIPEGLIVEPELDMGH